jgi:hypothetical protein
MCAKYISLPAEILAKMTICEKKSFRENGNRHFSSNPNTEQQMFWAPWNYVLTN